MTAPRELAIAVVGCGHWGPNHIRAFLSLPGARVTRAVDPSPKRCDHIARIHSSLAVTTSLDDALSDPGIDAIVVATPAATHYRIARAALEAGKHVLCEKPLCLVSSECAGLVALARERGLVLMVGHIFLFNSGIEKLRELIAAGDLGDLHYATAVRTNLGPIRQDVNSAFDLVSHEISIFDHLFDSSPERVSAVGRACLTSNTEDVSFVTLFYPGGVVANVTASWLSPKKVREITLVGSRRMATWNDLAPAPVAIYDRGALAEPYYENFGEFQLVVREGDVTMPRVSAEEPLRRQAQYFLDAVGRGDAGICSGERGEAVLRTLECIAKSMALGGAPVDVAGIDAMGAGGMRRREAAR